MYCTWIFRVFYPFWPFTTKETKGGTQILHQDLGDLGSLTRLRRSTSLKGVGSHKIAKKGERFDRVAPGEGWLDDHSDYKKNYQQYSKEELMNIQCEDIWF